MARYEHLRASAHLPGGIRPRGSHGEDRAQLRPLPQVHAGTELRQGSQRILRRILEANESRERAPLLEQLRQEIEGFQVLARLCHESGGFASTKVYLHVAEQVVGIAQQNEGWLRSARKAEQPPPIAEDQGVVRQSQNWQRRSVL